MKSDSDISHLTREWATTMLSEPPRVPSHREFRATATALAVDYRSGLCGLEQRSQAVRAPAPTVPCLPQSSIWANAHCGSEKSSSDQRVLHAPCMVCSSWLSSCNDAWSKKRASVSPPWSESPFCGKCLVNPDNLGTQIARLGCLVDWTPKTRHSGSSFEVW